MKLMKNIFVNNFYHTCNHKSFTMLSLKNNHPRDERIRFVEDTHTYYVDGSCAGYTSSTTLVHQLFEKFDADKIIGKMMRSPKWRFSPYYGMTISQIKDKWDNQRDFAANAGTSMHENIENYYNKKDHSTDTKEFGFFKSFEEDHEHLKPYRSEWVVFDEEAKVSGSIDMIYYDGEDTSSLVIADWKRSKEIKMENRWQRGISPHTNHLDDCNFIHYSLQLSIYKYILEKNYGKKISSCFLVILHPNQNDYLKYPIMDLDEEVSNIMNERILGKCNKNKKRKIGKYTEKKTSGGFDMSKVKF